MKLTILFKDPDAVDFALGSLGELDKEQALVAVHKWIKYGEYLTVVIDTVTGECVPKQNETKKTE